jgi:hypothetical protein
MLRIHLKGGAIFFPFPFSLFPLPSLSRLIYFLEINHIPLVFCDQTLVGRPQI